MWLDTPWMAAITALVLWWAATGVLLWRVHAADRGGPGAHVMSVILFLPLLVGGLIGAHGAAADPSPQGAYVGFLAALAIWGWIELAFLSGVITGPNTDPCPRSLFGARISAKLNLFLGVPRINTDFLPQPLAHLSGYFRQGPVSGFFPLSVTVLAATLGCFIERLWSAATPGAVVGFTLLTALCALALLEHWFMVWRLRDDKLWRWAVPASSATTDSLRGQTHGL
jgi:hypothetical protein